jgi:alanine racemase
LGSNPHFTGVEPDLACGRLTIDLSVLAENWRALAAISAPARPGAVVKADAYGLGVRPVVTALHEAGCRDFFVAQPQEGVEVRSSAPDARIYVITGAFSGSEAVFAEHQLIPLISSPGQLSGWLAGTSRAGASRPFGLHVDTGMNRSGLTLADALAASREASTLKAAGLDLVMSHLACADEPGHPMNAQQIESFQQARSAFSGIESSLANSACIITGLAKGTDLTRPGIAIYGGEAVNGIANPMKPVVTAEARIIQIRTAKKGETVSYGATMALTRDTKIAVATVGYADGFHRAGGSGVALRQTGIASGAGAIGGRRVPILGRVTMDFTMFDVTDIPDQTLDKSDWIELFGPTIALDDAARAAGTIGYELLTSLGHRYHRAYVSS